MRHTVPMIGQPELMVILVLVIWVAMLMWVSRDASRRGMNRLFWVVIVFFFHLLGLAAYLIAREMKRST
jgi:hypothetical protein